MRKKNNPGCPCCEESDTVPCSPCAIPKTDLKFIANWQQGQIGSCNRVTPGCGNFQFPQSYQPEAIGNGGPGYLTLTYTPTHPTWGECWLYYFAGAVTCQNGPVAGCTCSNGTIIKFQCVDGNLSLQYIPFFNCPGDSNLDPFYEQTQGIPWAPYGIATYSCDPFDIDFSRTGGTASVYQ